MSEADAEDEEAVEDAGAGAVTDEAGDSGGDGADADDAGADPDAGAGPDGEEAPAREIWIEKYRPRRFEEIVGHEDTVERVRSYVERDDLPNLLLSGPAGVGKCATGETPVLTGRGLRRMEDVVGGADGFHEPEDGLEVLTFEESGGFRYAEPDRVFGREASELVEVGTRDGAALTVTPEHPLLVLDGDGFDWRPAEDLAPGDRVVRPLDAPLPATDAELDWLAAMDGDRTFVTVSEEFARDHGIPVEQNHVGEKRRVIGAFRRDKTVDEVVDELGVPRKTVQDYRRQTADEDLDEPVRTCRLSYLRELEADDGRIREHVREIRHVSRNNLRSEPITPVETVDADVAAFVALALAEANVQSGRIKFYNTDRELLDRFERTARERFGTDPDCGTQKGVPYVAVRNRTLVEFLSSCFDVFDPQDGTDGPIASTILRAGPEARAAFLRAFFDAEAYVTGTDGTGAIELAQKDGDLITLVSYLLAGFGIPSRRQVEYKSATNSSGGERAYHVLTVSSATHLRRFADVVGFSLEDKAERLAEHAAGETNPNHDTVPTQAAVDALCRDLALNKTDLTTDSLDPDTPGREAYAEDLERVLDAVVDRMETAQEVRKRIDRIRPEVTELTRVPATWIERRSKLEPLATRKRLAEATGIRSDYLLQYGDGRQSPTARRTETLLAELGVVEETPPVGRVQAELDDAIDALGVENTRIAATTGLSGQDVRHLLENDDHNLRSLPRFGTVADRIREVAGEMLTESVLARVRLLDRLVAGDLYFDEVRSVESVEDDRRVYDLSVPGTRNYVAGRVPTVMHNTTLSTVIAREVYGEEWREHFLELNASDDRGIDVVRGRIKDFARTSFGGYDYRIVFLDEADSLCLPPGTEVVAGSPSSPEVKNVEDVAEDGEPMPSVDFETNEVRPDTGRLVDSGVADFFEVELADGREVVASPTHPFFVVGDDGELLERELRDLRPGDGIADFGDDLGLSRCEVCGDWTAGRFCSTDCGADGGAVVAREGHGDDEPNEAGEFDPAMVSDGGRRSVSTVEIRRIEYSHRGRAYNVSMEGTPNFVLANGVLTHNTDDAQAALRRTMEQFSNNTRFVLSCNYSSQIIDPIQSRCAVFRFPGLSDEAVGEYVRRIADSEGIELTEDGVEALAYVADGDMRRAINGLQAASVTGERVDEDAVFSVTATARPEEVEEMVELAVDGEFELARARLEDLFRERGLAGGDVIDQLHRSVWEMDFGDRTAVRVLERLGEADYRITAGADERVQLEALLASLSRYGHED